MATCRDGQQEHIRFVEGVFEKRSAAKVDKNMQSGTVVSWQPSEEFFTHVEIDVNEVKKLFKTIVCLCPGLTINFTVNNSSIFLSYK